MNTPGVLPLGSQEWDAILRTLQVSTAATALILVPGTLLGVWAARTRSRLRILVEAVAMMPLVVPPVVIGFLLLVAFQWLRVNLGVDILFTTWAAVAASAVIAVPLLIRTVRATVETIDPRLEQVAATLGASRLRILATVTVPLAWRGLVGGTVLAWARAAGEFGATIVVAGNMPGRTRTIPLAIWTAIQADRPVLGLALAAAAVAVLAVLLSEWLLPRVEPRRVRAAHRSS